MPQLTKLTKMLKEITKPQCCNQQQYFLACSIYANLFVTNSVWPEAAHDGCRRTLAVN